eukprot:CAMPEP_0170236080 /NCGR_PEP_ID=MMETSP0116_2-20130129/17786_1 /TAXON_ID=400756 /ORGANISM="Durinskia baltica, Strain CSIRO CS-38" /LENGTH=293 /DNA_ID=CAMNT_0010486875 /DNA_START=91 /DNA_END=968 /DNA_ORIENTATION=-
MHCDCLRIEGHEDIDTSAEASKGSGEQPSLEPHVDPELDDYDPRKPEYIADVSEEEAERQTAALLEQQISKLEGSMRRRGSRQQLCPRVSGHYETVLDEMRDQARRGLIQPGLRRTQSEHLFKEIPQPTPLSHCRRRTEPLFFDAGECPINAALLSKDADDYGSTTCSSRGSRATGSFSSQSMLAGDEMVSLTEVEEEENDEDASGCSDGDSAAAVPFAEASEQNGTPDPAVPDLELEASGQGGRMQAVGMFGSLAGLIARGAPESRHGLPHARSMEFLLAVGLPDGERYLEP